MRQIYVDEVINNHLFFQVFYVFLFFYFDIFANIIWCDIVSSKTEIGSVQLEKYCLNYVCMILIGLCSEKVSPNWLVCLWYWCLSEACCRYNNSFLGFWYWIKIKSLITFFWQILNYLLLAKVKKFSLHSIHKSLFFIISSFLFINCYLSSDL